MAVLPPDPIFTLRNVMGYVHCLCIPPSIGTAPPNRLLAGTEKGFVHFWSLETNRDYHKLEVGPSILSIQHTDDDLLITQEKEGYIKLWNMQNGSNYIHTSTINTGIGFCRCILSQNQYIAASQSNSVVEIYDLKTQNSIVKFVPEEAETLGNVMCLKHLNYNGNDYILAGYESGDLFLWTPKTGKYVSRLKLRECMTSVDFDVTTGRGISGNASKYIQIFNINKNLNMSLKCEIAMTNEGCNIVKLRNDRKIFVSGGWDGHLRIYSWRSLRLLAVLTEHRLALTDIVFSDKPVANWNVMLMAATGADGQITLWDLYN